MKFYQLSYLYVPKDTIILDTKFQIRPTLNSFKYVTIFILTSGGYWSMSGTILLILSYFLDFGGKIGNFSAYFSKIFTYQNWSLELEFTYIEKRMRHFKLTSGGYASYCFKTRENIYHSNFDYWNKIKVLSTELYDYIIIIIWIQIFGRMQREMITFYYF